MVLQILEELFDSQIKVRLLKLFLRNPKQKFSVSEVVKKIQGDSRAIKKQIQGLVKINLLKTRKIKPSQKSKKSKKLVDYFFVNPEFVFYQELSSLILKSSPASREKIFEKLKQLGRVKLAVLSGIFLNLENSRVDLFLVADNFSSKKLKQFLIYLEAEVGKEIDYVVLSSEEFNYRYHMFDRFIRDILERPHEKLINKLNV